MTASIITTANTAATTIKKRTPRRTVSFPEKEASDVFIVPRKTEVEALTLFYSPEDCDRFRAEAQWEKLAKEAQNIEKLNAMTQMARRHFKPSPSSPSSCHNSSMMMMMTPMPSHQQQASFRRHRGAPKRCAGMA